MTRSAESLPEAGPDDLPPLLVAPPWTRRDPAPEPPVLRLEPWPVPDTVAWEEGERERWLRTPLWEPSWRGDLASRFPAEPPGRDRAILEELRLSELPETRDPAALRAWLETRPDEPWDVRYRAEAWLLAEASEPLALALWEAIPETRWTWLFDAPERFLARFGLQALPRLLVLFEKNDSVKREWLLPFGTAALVPRLADLRLRDRRWRPFAHRWLLRHAGCAAAVLIPRAVGEPGAERRAAEAALRFLAANGRQGAILREAERYGEEAAVAVGALLASDPLRVYPVDPPQRKPAFWQPAAFARPLLRGRRAALPLSAVEHLGTVLAMSRLDEPYAGVEVVRAACDPVTLGLFAWDLFEAWEAAGRSSRDVWAFHALGLIGGDECARRLGPVVRNLSADHRQRAITILEILESLGSEVALLQIGLAAEKAKVDSIRRRARRKLEEAAEERGIPVEDLEDRIVPDGGLEPDGTLELSYGGRSFRAGFDDLLKPFVRDAAGRPLRDLPAPGRRDDRAPAEEARALWRGLKKDVPRVVSLQAGRLEQAMCARRLWSAEAFSFLRSHPLLGRLARRLVWGIPADGAGWSATFRIAEDGSLAGPDDEPWPLAAECRVGLPHRLELADAVAEAWLRLLADYEIAQPFPQLAREVFRPSPEERDGARLERVAGLRVPTGRVLALDARGWRHGPAQDNAVCFWWEKPLPGGRWTARLDLDPGVRVFAPMEEPQQNLGAVTLHVEAGGGAGLTFGDLDPIVFSELARDVEGMRG